MTKFTIYIKSHHESPDFEDEVWVEDKHSAARAFKWRNPHSLVELTAEDLLDYIEESPKEDEIIYE